jgi:hypothetical protein
VATLRRRKVLTGFNSLEAGWTGCALQCAGSAKTEIVSIDAAKALVFRLSNSVLFTPNYSSRPNQVERWFTLITPRAIRRGMLSSATAESILEKLIRPPDYF